MSAVETKAGPYEFRADETREITVRGANVRQPTAAWEFPPPRVYRCRVVLLTEEDGMFSALVPALPGVTSQGVSSAEAMQNIREALCGAIQTYLQDNGTIPWQHEAERTRIPGAVEKWIAVNV